jgi:selenide,water dikinase
MLPGTLAGQFTRQDMQIDLRALADKAQAELLLAEVTGLDLESKTLHFVDAPPLPFDAMSVGVGSMPAGYRDFDSPLVVPVKPMQSFLDRLDQQLASAADASDRPVVAVVGGGVAGIEIALCLRTRLNQRLPGCEISIELLTAGNTIGDGLRPRSRRRLERLLDQRGVTVVRGFRVEDVTDREVISVDHLARRAHCVVWATEASPPPVLASLGLPTDRRGFLAVNRSLQTTAGLPIFAVGDCGTMIESPSPKAGVYAVRQAPILWENLQACLQNRDLSPFEPQQDFLKIVNTGDGKALLEYKGATFHARWCMALKTWIDRRFIASYQFGNRADGKPMADRRERLPLSENHPCVES